MQNITATTPARIHRVISAYAPESILPPPPRMPAARTVTSGQDSVKEHSSLTSAARDLRSASSAACSLPPETEPRTERVTCPRHLRSTAPRRTRASLSSARVQLTSHTHRARLTGPRGSRPAALAREAPGPPYWPARRPARRTGSDRTAPPSPDALAAGEPTGTDATGRPRAMRTPGTAARHRVRVRGGVTGRSG